MRGRWVLGAILIAALVLLGAATVVLTGAYNVAADAPHRSVVASLLQTVRYRSIAVRASSLAVPADLTSSRRIAAGAPEYAEMCSQCHLAPGEEKTEIAQGLYPAAPELSRGDALTAAEQFWVVKHGIKFTAMPAWGATHEDSILWNIVAFVRKLPSLSAVQYKVMTANSAAEHERQSHHAGMPGMSNDH